MKNIYERMVAGRALATASDAERQVYYLASSSLDQESVHVVWHFQNEEVRYLAIPASYASNGIIATQLASAIPGSPSHKGWGIYRLTTAAATAVVVCSPDVFEFVYHDPDAVNGYLAPFSHLPVFDVGDLPDEDLIPAVQGARQENRRALSKVVAASFYSATAVLMLAAVAVAVSGYLQKTVGDSSAKTRAELSKMVDDIATRSKLSDQLEEVVRVSSVVTRAGGWIESYVYKEGKTAFMVVMPEWVTQDYVSALGPGVTADINPAKQIIEYRKNSELLKK